MKINIRFKDFLITLFIFVSTTVISILIENIGIEEHVTTVFAFAVFLISLFTDGYFWGILSAIAGMFAVNYAFTYPYLAFDFITPVNLISAVIMVIISLITSMLTTQIKRNEAIKAEGERERMRANLLRAVSHDLRTPLTTIYSASSVLRNKRDVLSMEQQDSMLCNIQKDAEWLIRMVENLLSITRIDDGAVRLTRESVVVDELVDSVIVKFLKRYPSQNVEVKLPDEIVFVLADPILLEQVIINLLENAVHHAVNMTQLSLTVSCVGRKVFFEVADNGEGITDDKLSHIFEAGYDSVSDATEGNKRFAGIGLSVCASIIKAHNGSITVKKRKPHGVIFTFVLEKEI